MNNPSGVDPEVTKKYKVFLQTAFFTVDPSD